MSYSIKAISFDLDDTLWEIEPVVEHAERRLHEWLLSYYPRLAKKFSIADMKAMRFRLLKQRPELKSDLSGLRKLALTQAAEAVDYEPDFIEQAFQVFIDARHQLQFYHDVLPALERLQQHYRLCVLTNGNADIYRLTPPTWFSCSIKACDVQAVKPEPAMFSAVCEKLQLHPTEIVHVGDDIQCDVEGALAFGMHAVWMNRRRKAWTGKGKPHAIVASLVELEKWLAQRVN